jgi:hypothetical protein
MSESNESMEIQCCDKWLAYPTPSQETECPTCHTTFSVKPSESTMITGRENIERVRWLTVRSALGLELHGLKRRHAAHRSTRVLANEITGKNSRTIRDAYLALDAHITEKMGEEFSSPLIEFKPRKI